ncbi:hypothetical protein LCGC14_3093620 [marine sediment metagenome]|uniref:HNH nuclease domain-containing protein n=1 Tax=marine sediment metagenome TaxID=412755 RepID=A0A0F8WYM9_9ZZZZ
MPLSKERDKERKRIARLEKLKFQPEKEKHVRLPFRIYLRDNFACQYCGRTPQDGVKLELDHVFPKSLGGSDDDDNLVTACWECNSAKSDLPLVQPNTTQMILNGTYVVVPELDADGEIIPEEITCLM